MAISKILVAVDDDYFGEAITQFLTSHTWSPDVQFKVLNVIETPSATDVLPAYWEEAIELSWEYGWKLVKGIASKIKNALNTSAVDEVVVNGSPKEEILHLATTWGADLIIMGSHGRRGITRLLLGSVSMAVVSHATCSTVIVRAGQTKAKEHDLSTQAQTPVSSKS